MYLIFYDLLQNLSCVNQCLDDSLLRNEKLGVSRISRNSPLVAILITGRVKLHVWTTLKSHFWSKIFAKVHKSQVWWFSHSEEIISDCLSRLQRCWWSKHLSIRNSRIFWREINNFSIPDVLVSANVLPQSEDASPERVEGAGSWDSHGNVKLSKFGYLNGEFSSISRRASIARWFKGWRCSNTEILGSNPNPSREKIFFRPWDHTKIGCKKSLSNLVPAITEWGKLCAIKSSLVTVYRKFLTR